MAAVPPRCHFPPVGKWCPRDPYPFSRGGPQNILMQYSSNTFSPEESTVASGGFEFSGPNAVCWQTAQRSSHSVDAQAEMIGEPP